MLAGGCKGPLKFYDIRTGECVKSFEQHFDTNDLVIL